MHVPPFWQYVVFVEQKLIFCSHLELVNPHGQVQTNDPMLGCEHTPPFIHGFEAQLLMIV